MSNMSVQYLLILLLLVNLYFNPLTAGSLKPRIYKGKPVEKGQFPWVAYLRIFPPNDDYFTECGGNLIDERHILTAAHCLYIDNETLVQPKDIYISLNLSDKPWPMRNENPTESYNIHPEFDYNTDWIMGNDLAVIRLKSPVKESFQPISIYSSADLTFNSKLSAAGYGSLDKFESESDNLRLVQVDLIPKGECENQRKAFVEKQLALGRMDSGKIPQLLDSQLCAINRQTRGDTCAGDSGGPLMYQINSTHYYLVGMITGSWTDCGSADVPGIYTWVAKFVDWIKFVGAKPRIVQF